MFQMQINPEIFHSRLSRLARCAILTAGGLLLVFAMQANAAVMPGDQFNFNWTETSGPAPGLSGSAALTVGAATTPPFFSLSSFDVFQSGSGFCGPCSSLTEVLSDVKFDSITFGLLGHITGTFTASGGGTRSYDLSLTDIATGTGGWEFKEFSSGNLLQDASGTYTPLVATVDEPSVMLLLALGVAGLAAARRRKQ